MRRCGERVARRSRSGSLWAGSGLGAGLLALLLAAPAAAQDVGAASPADLGEIDRCVRANAPKTTLVLETKMTSMDHTGADRTHEGKLYWKRFEDDLSRILIKVEAPPDLRGSSYLVIEKPERNDMFVYLPELEKVRRITPRTVSGSLFGTDFSYEDVEHLMGVGESTATERLADSVIDGRPAFVTRSSPGADSGSAYDNVTSFIDRETCVPLKIEFYQGTDLRKVMTSDPAKVAKAGQSFVPQDVKIVDLRRETESRLVTEKVSVDGKVPNRMFTQSQLMRGR